jgi:hypothetical protein
MKKSPPDQSFSSLELHKNDCPDNDEAMDWCRATQLREQLLGELRELERQLARLQAIDGCPDFSLQQSCRQMILARQALFRRLRRY